jgi:dTDP-4-dehydrorhamnose reductase
LIDSNTIWITGAGGLIGNYLVQKARDFIPRARVIALTRQHLDLTDFNAVKAQFKQQQPKLVVHCAAMSQSPACQANPQLAGLVNVEVTRMLAALCADIPFVFFSSDLVFDGKKGNYDETAALNPLSVYGETKVEAERVVLENPAHTVIRTSLNGGTSPAGNRGFNEQLREDWTAGRVSKLFTDEFRCPIPALETARAVWDLIVKNRPGLYHLAGSEKLSRWQIGELIAARWPQLHPRLEATSLKTYAGAPRPADCSLNCAKIQSLLSFPLLGLSGWLRSHPQEVF